MFFLHTNSSLKKSISLFCALSVVCMGQSCSSNADNSLQMQNPQNVSMQEFNPRQTVYLEQPPIWNTIGQQPVVVNEIFVEQAPRQNQQQNGCLSGLGCCLLTIFIIVILGTSIGCGVYYGGYNNYTCGPTTMMVDNTLRTFTQCCNSFGNCYTP